MRLFDFDKYLLSDKNGTYGGNSGNKEGITIGDEFKKEKILSKKRDSYIDRYER